MIKLALIGFPLEHSASPSIFRRIAAEADLEDQLVYDLIPLQTDEELKAWKGNVSDYTGFNVTSPLKYSVYKLCDSLDEFAMAAASVNTVLCEKGKWQGYNTDVAGFDASLSGWLPAGIDRALILGTGGAARAVRYALRLRGIQSRLVSRSRSRGQLTYNDLSPGLIGRHRLIVQATPLGTWPETERTPPFPIQLTGTNHYLYDLVYNPDKSLFLKKGEERGAQIKNGLAMLHLQAIEAWRLWNPALNALNKSGK